ncbi:unknown [Ruminococcus sp. CAG:379]|nr:unknown [Ruminococcus sp. CAG:379]
MGRFRQLYSRNGIQSQIALQYFMYGFHTVFPGRLHHAVQLAVDLYRQVMLAAQIGQRPFQHRIQFFNGKHLFQSLQELQCQFLREGVGGGDFQHLDLSGVILQRLL